MPMPLPPPVEALWRDLAAARAEVLKEAEGLSQAQADWRPGPQDWSVGEILHHLTLAEIATGKLTSKILKDAGGGPADPPPVVWRPSAHAALPLGQWWLLQARHDADHLDQLRRLKASPGFPGR